MQGARDRRHRYTETPQSSLGSHINSVRFFNGARITRLPTHLLSYPILILSRTLEYTLIHHSDGGSDHSKHNHCSPNHYDGGSNDPNDYADS